MKENTWNDFWKQVGDCRGILVLDNGTLFHYVVLEYLGKGPQYEVTKEEQKSIRELPKGTEEYNKLNMIYNNRIKQYTLSE